jgi:hypothetical protein
VNELLARLARLVHAGLGATAELWPPIQRAYAYVHRAAHVLANADQLDRSTLQQRYCELVAELQATQEHLGPLAPAGAHFLKVTASYWPELFACYDVADLPRTNNGFRTVFRQRPARRATGRTGASPALVVRGAERVAAVATKLHAFSAAELCPAYLRTWKTLRQQVTARHDMRRLQARFRRDPVGYLATLEERLVAKRVSPS